MEILAGIAAAKQALDIAKTLKGIEKSYDGATLRAQLAELISALADAKMAMVDAKEALAEKDRLIEELKDNFQTRSDLMRGDGDYHYFPGPNGSPLGFPVCPTCEADGRIIQLKQNGRANQAKCPKCKSEFCPVSCYLPGGSQDETLHGREERLLKERNDRVTAELARYNRGY